jgi:hypothetical protein
MIKVMKKLTATVLCLATCVTLFTGCGGKNVELTLKINDSSFNFKSTVQDIYDAGFVICDTGYGEITSEEDLPDMEARTVDTISQYYIGLPTSDTKADYTGVTIQVYNPTSSDCSFKECSIFNYTYEIDPDATADITVLFNDVDFSTLDPQGAVTAMETMGITFDEDDKTEFLDPATNDGYGWTLSTSSASYRYGLNSSTYKTNSLYIEEVYFEKDLDVQY